MSEHRADYQGRINRATDYIDANLDQKLDLDSLSEVACFSGDALVSQEM